MTVFGAGSSGADASSNRRVDAGDVSAGSALSTASLVALTLFVATIEKTCSQNCPPAALLPARSRYASSCRRPLRLFRYFAEAFLTSQRWWSSSSSRLRSDTPGSASCPCTRSQRRKSHLRRHFGACAWCRRMEWASRTCSSSRWCSCWWAVLSRHATKTG